jgi:excisionase family DNA binding protein
MSDDPLLTPAEVADELRIDTRTVYKLLRSQTLPHLDLGHRTKRISRSALDAYKKETETGECS